MKNKVLKAIAVFAGVMFMVGAGGANSENVYIPAAMCAVGLILGGIILYANIDYLERRYGQGGYIKSEPMVEAVIPNDHMTRMFVNYDLSKN